MKAPWITAALIGPFFLAACSSTQPADTGAESENAPAVTETAPPPASPEVDEPAAVPPPAPAPEARRPAPAPRQSSRAAAPAVREPAPVESPRVTAPEPPAPPRVEYRQLTVPAGTALPLELLTPLSSQTAAVETPVRAKLKQAISVEGYPVMPAGTEFIGSVTDVAQAGRVKGRARVTFAFTEAAIAGAREKLQTDPVTFEAEATKSEDATKIGAGAGIGAVIGGILGGGSGAAKGAAIGGAAGTGAVLATKGQEVDVAAGADIAATLAEPFRLRVRQ